MATLPPQILGAIRQVVSELDSVQLHWLSGYMAGLADAAPSASQGAPAAQAVATALQPAEPLKLLILYASQSGNGKGVAEALYQDAQQAGFDSELLSMADFKPSRLKKAQLLAVVASTYGEGDPPDDAEELHSFLDSKRAPKLTGLKYTVLALGDSGYELFCQTGKEFDRRLEKLGASRLLTRVDCDVDFETAAAQWRSDVIARVGDEVNATASQSAEVIPLPGTVSSGPASAAAVASGWTRQNPFTATLLASQKITGRDSVRDIRHVELDLAGSGITYRPGDSLGVWFENEPELVDQLLSLLALDGDETVSAADEQSTLREALTARLELTRLTPAFVKAWAELVQSADLTARVADRAALAEYLDSRQVIDVVRDYPPQNPLTAVQFIGCLRKLTPRLYSIASSQAEVEDEVHLTVGLVSYDTASGSGSGAACGESERLGGASGYLSRRLEAGGEVKVWVDSNDHFRLPDNPDTPVIMVGPGTGIAPFRAFLQQRDATDAAGDNWLIFGNPNFTQDFLYQVEIQAYVKSGLLSRVDLAWSRDQAEKVYVQDKIHASGAEIWQWLERGAHFYVCGDAARMAKDVHEALVSLVAEHGGKTEQQAQEYVSQLRKAKRYQRDVY